MLKFLKNWTLPIAMLTGTLAYFMFSYLPFLQSVKPVAGHWVSILTPILIFAQLLLTFCKVEPKELKPVLWHAWLLLFQFLCCMLVAFGLLFFSMPEVYRAVFEGAMVCFICPTATAAAVITKKLGGSAGSITTYTLLSNLLAACVVPCLFPIIEVHAGAGFWPAFSRILLKVFPLLLCPFLLASFLRLFFPRIREWLGKFSNSAFYLWAIALSIVSAQTVRSLVHSEASVWIKISIALVGLLTCALQFYVGKRVGNRYSDRISSGQALGQKNTILAIWMAYTYLTPLSSVGPGSYVLWQNLFNSYQLWKKNSK